MDQENLGRLFIQIDHLLLSWAASQADKPFSMTTFFALDFLITNGPTSMKTLADGLDITPASLTALSQKLESAGWIERKPNPHDRRGALLLITPSGRNTLAADYQTFQSFFDLHLNPQQQLELTDLLQKIAAQNK